MSERAPSGVESIGQTVQRNLSIDGAGLIVAFAFGAGLLGQLNRGVGQIFHDVLAA